MADIVMPRLSDTMEEGTILRWLKRDGERGGARRGARRDRDRQGDDDLRVRPGGRAADRSPRRASTLAVGALIARVGETAEQTDDASRPRGAGRRPRASAKPAGDASARPRLRREQTQIARGGGTPSGRRRADQGLAAGAADRAEAASTWATSPAAARAGGSSRRTCSRPARCPATGRLPAPPAAQPGRRPGGGVRRRRARRRRSSCRARSRRSRGGWPSRRRRSPTSRCRSTSTWRSA